MIMFSRLYELYSKRSKRTSLHNEGRIWQREDYF